MARHAVPFPGVGPLGPAGTPATSFTADGMLGPDALQVVIPLVQSDQAWRTDAPLVDPVVASLVVVYAIPRDRGRYLVTDADLPLLGVDRAELAAAATDNLLDRMADLEVLERPDGCGMLRLGDSLEASSLVVLQLWQNIAEILADDVLVAVPARDVVLFCPAQGFSPRRALRSARDRALAVSNHQLTAELLLFTSDGWQPDDE